MSFTNFRAGLKKRDLFGMLVVGCLMFVETNIQSINSILALLCKMAYFLGRYTSRFCSLF